MSENLNLWKAIHVVQGEVRKVKRDSANSHFKNRFASLESVWDAIREPVNSAGLIILQSPGEFDDGILWVITTIVHVESGEQHAIRIPMPLAKRDSQGVGSAITYGCRYSLMVFFGLAPSDDDGEANRHDSPREVVRTAPNGKPVPTFEQATEEHRESIDAILGSFESGDPGYARQCWDEIPAEAQMALWVAQNRGGHFSNEQRRALKGMGS